MQKQQNQPAYSLSVTSEDINSDNIHDFEFPKGFDHHQSAIPNNPCHNFKFRIVVFFLAMFVTKLGLWLTIPTNQIECINDPWHNISEPINQFINDHTNFASFLQIVSSLILDVSYFSLTIYWVIYVRNFRFFLTQLAFYGIRFLHLQLLQLKFAPGYYWEEPAIWFPSLLAKYGMLSDFFYSGHCGFLTLCGLEWRKLGKQKLFYLSMVLALYQAFIVTVFRIHYTIDVPGGFVYAHYIYLMCCHWEAKVDYLLKYCCGFVNNDKAPIQQSIPREENPNQNNNNFAEKNSIEY